MAAKREDQRVRMTKMLLHDAFLRLLAEKPVQNVSVKELCEAAGVNRGTFYQHYLDVYDLMAKMQEQLLCELDDLLATTPVIGYDTHGEASVRFIHSLFTFFERNREMCAVLLGDHGDKMFVADIIRRGREKSVNEYLALYPGTTLQAAELFYQFVAWGFIGLLQYTLQNPGFASFKAVATGAERIVTEAARFFQPDEAAALP